MFSLNKLTFIGSCFHATWLPLVMVISESLKNIKRKSLTVLTFPKLPGWRRTRMTEFHSSEHTCELPIWTLTFCGVTNDWEVTGRRKLEVWFGHFAHAPCQKSRRKYAILTPKRVTSLKPQSTKTSFPSTNKPWRALGGTTADHDYSLFLYSLEIQRANTHVLYAYQIEAFWRNCVRGCFR